MRCTSCGERLTNSYEGARTGCRPRSVRAKSEACSNSSARLGTFLFLHGRRGIHSTYFIGGCADPLRVHVDEGTETVQQCLGYPSKSTQTKTGRSTPASQPPPHFELLTEKPEFVSLHGTKTRQNAGREVIGSCHRDPPRFVVSNDSIVPSCVGPL